MKKEFVPYNFSLRMKALGFNEPCFSFYSKGGKHNFDVQYPCTNIGSWSEQEHYCSAPTFSQCFRWFREKYSLVAEFNWHFPSKCYATSIYPNDFYLQTKNYEEAEIACLEKLLEIVEQKEK